MVQRKQKAPKKTREAGEGKQAKEPQVRDSVYFWVFDPSFNWGKGRVVSAEDYDKLLAERDKLKQALKDLQQFW
jgi:hypothetical protein